MSDNLVCLRWSILGQGMKFSADIVSLPTPSITSVAKDVRKRIVPATQVVRFETKCLELYGNLSSVSWVCHQCMVIFSQDFDNCWCCSRQNSLQSFSLSLSLLLSIHHYTHKLLFWSRPSWGCHVMTMTRKILGKIASGLHAYTTQLNLSYLMNQCRFFNGFC